MTRRTESHAFNRLLAAYNDGKVGLVTSDVTLDEIKKYAGVGRTLSERTFHLLEKVPVVAWDKLLGIHSYNDDYTSLNSPLIQRDPLFGSLCALGLELVDAQHVFVAANQDSTRSSRATAASWRARKTFDGSATLRHRSRQTS